MIFLQEPNYRRDELGKLQKNKIGVEENTR